MRHQQIDSIQDLQDFNTNNNIKTQERNFLSQTGINWSTNGEGEKEIYFLTLPIQYWHVYAILFTG